MTIRRVTPKLASIIDALGPDVVVRPVGGVGEDPAFDLDGSGIALGGSADQPADPKRLSTPRPEFIGFRVVRSK